MELSICIYIYIYIHFSEFFFEISVFYLQDYIYIYNIICMYVEYPQSYESVTLINGSTDMFWKPPTKFDAHPSDQLNQWMANSLGAHCPLII